MTPFDDLLDRILHLVTIGTLLIGAVAVYTAVRGNSRQVAVQIFLAYSDRVRQVRRATFNDLTRPDALLEATYLIFEFYSLRRRGYIPNPIWQIWESDMTELLNTAAFLELWPKICHRFDHHPHFLTWVEERHRLRDRIPRYNRFEFFADPATPSNGLREGDGG